MMNIANYLWGEKAKFRYLLIASAVLLLTMLGAKEIWTQEHRWADIVFGMFYRQDFLHPYLGESRYYDKPLLSYWMMAALAKLMGGLSAWSLRLPSALSGLLAIWSIYRLGSALKNRQLGLMAGWMLLTTFYFVFWARVSSADMMNLAGSLFAVSWYYQRKENAGFIDYTVFFIILALTSLCKGLVGAIIPLLAVFVDICLQKSWRKHFRWVLLLSLVPALVIYLIPFMASSYFGGEEYGQSGLYLVYKENILRYFQPFDHKGPVYTYLLYLPIYTFPWSLFLIPALLAVKSRWSQMSTGVKWLLLTSLVLFCFFTFSGSRRSYYVLPLVPFAILIAAEWIQSTALSHKLKRYRFVAATVCTSLLLLFVGMDLLPAWYYSRVGAKQFAVLLKHEVSEHGRWKDYRIVMLDSETKLSFYLGLPPQTKYHGVKGDRVPQTAASLLKAWPFLKNKSANTIFITRSQYVPLLKGYFSDYRLVKRDLSTVVPFQSFYDKNAPVAFVPTA